MAKLEIGDRVRYEGFVLSVYQAMNGSMVAIVKSKYDDNRILVSELTKLPKGRKKNGRKR